MTRFTYYMTKEQKKALMLIQIEDDFKSIKDVIDFAVEEVYKQRLVLNK